MSQQNGREDFCASPPPERASSGALRGDDRGVPTLAEIESTIAKFGKAVDEEQITLATIHAAVCVDFLERIQHAMRAGAALISVEDRELALVRQYFSSMCDDNGEEEAANEAEADARRLLQLPAEVPK